MNYKKIAGLLIFPMLFCTGSVFAAKLSVNDVKVNWDVLVVSGVLEKEANAELLIYVSEAVENPQKEDVKYVRQATTDASGAFSLEFEMQENEKGRNFMVYINGEKADSAVTKRFSYVGVATRQALLASINGAQSAAELKTVLAENEAIAAVLGMLTEAEVSEDFYKNRPAGGYTGETLVSAYNSLALVQLTNAAANAAEVEKILNKAPELITNRKAEMEGFVTQIIFQNRPYTSLVLLNAEYANGVAFYTINHATRETMEQTLIDYAGQLGYADNTDYKSYLNAGGEKKVFMTKEIVSKAASKPYMSAGDITAAIKAAENKWNESQNNNSSSPRKESSGGGGYAVSTPEAGQNMEKNEGENKSTALFSDVGEAFWGRTAIEALAKKEILKGDEGKFRPNDKITREEFVTVVVNAFGFLDENAECSFTDTQKEAWYYRYVASAFEKNIISGISEGVFGSGLPITREDVAVILSRIMGEDTDVQPDFIDGDTIADYAKSGVALMQNKGIIRGMDDGSFAPKNNCTRAEAAAMIYNMLNAQGGLE